MNPFINDIEKLDKKELQELLSKLTLYRDLKKGLGSRGKDVFEKLQTGAKKLVVEYFSATDRSYVEEQACSIYKNVFSLNVEPKDIEFRESANILGGMRVFVDDKVLDLSYLKIENQFSK